MEEEMGELKLCSPQISSIKALYQTQVTLSWSK